MTGSEYASYNKLHEVTLQVNEYLLRDRRIHPLNAKFKKWSNTLKQFVGKLPTNCLIVFDHFVGLAFKGLRILSKI